MDDMMMMDMDMEDIELDDDMEMDVVMAWAYRMEDCGYDDVYALMEHDMVAWIANIHEFAESEISAYDDMGDDPHDDGITDDMIAWARTPYTDR